MRVNSRKLPETVNLNAAIERMLSAPVADEDEFERQQLERLRSKHIARFRDDSGRFFHCTFDNYVVSNPDQKRIFERLKNCANNIGEFHRYGMVLIGRVGTGKDHLAAAVMRAAVASSLTCRWIAGEELYDRSARAWGEGDRRSILGKYVEADCLIISDAVTVRNWKETRAEVLSQLVGRRYNAGRPTWITANVRDKKHLRELALPDVYDRLTERAVVELFTWDSYRQGVECSF